MGFHNVAYLPFRASFCTTFLINCDRSENLRTTTCLKIVAGVNKGMLPVKYFINNKPSFWCHLNFIEIARRLLVIIIIKLLFVIYILKNYLLCNQMFEKICNCAHLQELLWNLLQLLILLMVLHDRIIPGKLVGLFQTPYE